MKEGENMKKYVILKTEYDMYFIAERIEYESGYLAFWHQVSKYYFYKKSALKKLDELKRKVQHE